MLFESFILSENTDFMADAHDQEGRGNRRASPSTKYSLIVRLKDRHEDAWNEMVHIYYPLVYGWCRRDGLKGDDILDVVQDVFQAVARSLSELRLSKPGDTFRGWLRGITRYKLLDFYRRKKNHPVAPGGSGNVAQLAAVPDPQTEDVDDNPDDTAIVVHRALELIRPEFKPTTWQAFWRVAMDNAEPAEVAAALKLTANAVYKAKARVLHRLRVQLGDIQK